MSKSKIEWTEETWNPVIGCKKVSEGCRNCYAEKMSIRLSAMNNKCSPDYASILKYNDSGKPIGFNGNIKLMLERLDIPLKKKKPTMFFVNSMSDLFHPVVPFGFMDEMLAQMELNQQHIFQVLTKRPKRALGYFEWRLSQYPQTYDNVWFGVSVEDKKNKDRIDILRKIPVAIRWISFEPLLEDLGEIDLTGIHWVVVGGESGHNARPMQPKWVRNIRTQCEVADVPFFFKQGSKANWKDYKDINSFPKDLQIRQYPER